MARDRGMDYWPWGISIVPIPCTTLSAEPPGMPVSAPYRCSDTNDTHSLLVEIDAQHHVAVLHHFPLL